MYIPRSFRVQGRALLHELIDRHGFAVLFSQGEAGPYATHLPFLADPGRGEHGTLSAHMARANPHWTSWDDRAGVVRALEDDPDPPVRGAARSRGPV